MAVRKAAVAFLACVLSSPLLVADAICQEVSHDEAAIREVLERSYVEGLHVRRDEAAVRAGFHSDFVMTVHDGDGVITVPLDMWLERLELDGQRNPLPVEGRFQLIDISGETAIAKLEIHENGEHVYTDYFGLYKLPEGWKIMNKLFQSHPSTP